MACTRYGTGYVGAEAYVLAWPDNWGFDQSRRGLVALRGGGPGNAMTNFAAVRKWAQLGVPAISADLGSTTRGEWGNDTILSRITSAWEYMKTRLNVKPDKLLLGAGSAGNINGFNYLIANPASVAAMYGVIPALNLADIHDRNVLSSAADIEAAYGGLAGYQAAEPLKNPYNRIADIAASNVPIKLWTSSDDTAAKPEYIAALDAAASNVTQVDMGAFAHTVSPAVTEATALEFVRPHVGVL
ncbi:MAG: hypothetical protein M3340_02205 [Actinomycetota bacterium]|nr:hypothetical protein [Actinomycetota bacterium]